MLVKHSPLAFKKHWTILGAHRLSTSRSRNCRYIEGELPEKGRDGGRMGWREGERDS